MDSPELILAVPEQIGDNRLRAEYESFLEAALAMGREPGAGPVWGTADKSLLADLVARGQRGDLGAMESLYEMFKRPIFGLAYRHTANQAVAEDLLQDAFLKVFTHLREVRDIETFPAWVYRIALNTCYSFLRQKKTQNEKLVPLGDVEGRIEEPSGEPVEHDLREPIQLAIAALPNRLQSVFVLHDVQGYKHGEISRLLGCSVGTSKSQLFKARLKVRDFLRARKIV